MKKIFLTLLTALSLAACTETYRIDGTCSVPNIEGKRVYLKVYQSGSMAAIDSCRIKNGTFTLHGSRDSIEMGNIFVDDQSIAPIVLDGTDLYIKIGVSGQQIGGSAMNDSLYHFIQAKNSIDSLMADLPHREGQMIMDGMDYEEVQEILNQNVALLSEMHDHLITTFIKTNASNVMGPGVFMILTSSMPYPALTPQIEEILTVAPPRFKNHPYVKSFVETAEENMMRIRDGEPPLR